MVQSYFPPDELEDNLKQFVELLQSDYVAQYNRSTNARLDDNAAAQIKTYFESLSDEQKMTMLAGDLFGEDNEKKYTAVQFLSKIDGDFLEKTKYLNELCEVSHMCRRSSKKRKMRRGEK